MKTDDEKWDFVAKSLAIMEEQNIIQTEACRSALIAPESSLCTPLHKVNEMLINALALLVDDKSDWVEWFVYECRYGKRPMEATVNGDPRVIDSIDKLRWIVEVESK